MAKQFVYPIHIFTEDTDCGGVVYHANYLKFMDRARTAWLNQLGLPLAGLAENHHYQFIIRSTELEFLRPAKLSMNIEIVSQIDSATRATLLFDHVAREADHHHHILCRGKLKLVCVDNSFNLIPIPNSLLEKLI